MSSPPDLWRVALSAPLTAVEPFADAMAACVETVSWFETPDPAVWQVEGFCRDKPDMARLAAALAVTAASLGAESPAVAVARTPSRDWVTENLRRFPPLIAGRYFVHGSHFDGKVPPGSWALQVDAGLAFGSGEHPTTRGCLLALDRLARRRRRLKVLDMGCGSGILAMGAALAWKGKGLACDIDPASVRVAAENLRINGLRRWVRAAASDGYRNPAIAKAGPYDLITANILARPLCRMAGSLAKRLGPGGRAVLSGLLRRQERQVLSAHRRQGLALEARIVIDGWSTLILRRRGLG